MNTIETIIRESGGLAVVKQDYLSLDNPPFMRFVIEIIAGPVDRGPCQDWEVSVAHYGELNDDLMRDPEMCFRVSVRPDGPWHWTPCYFRNDYFGLEHLPEAIDANPQLRRDLTDFARMWDRNLNEQGFVEVFRELQKRRGSVK